MRSLSPRKIVIGAILFAAIGVGMFFVLRGSFSTLPATLLPTENDTAVQKVTGPAHSAIGKSVEGRAIESFTYGTGKTRLLFVGGIHGGYEWNSVVLAYRFMDYLGANPKSIPSTLSVTVIPSANPDGVYRVVGKTGRFTAADVPTDEKVQVTGRFNANGVDLNRNFDCRWRSNSMWRGTEVSGGTAAFSEPETKAIRDFVAAYKPVAAVFWHSQSNAVYASECKNGILPETLALMNAYAEASGYPAVKSFDAYPVTGDAEGWLASVGIPAITVELKTHTAVEWEKNFAGVKALFEYFK